MSSKRNINIFLVSLILIFAIILGWSFANLFNNNDSDQYIDNSFNLINHNGEEVSIKSYLNKNKVFFFGFTHCPDVCPMGVSILSNVIDDIEERADIDDYKFIFVTVDPDRDTPHRLNKFLSQSGIASRRKSDELIKMATTEVNGVLCFDPAYDVKP